MPDETIPCRRCKALTPHERVWGPVSVADPQFYPPGTTGSADSVDLDQTTVYELWICRSCGSPALQATPLSPYGPFTEEEIAEVTSYFPPRDQWVHWKPLGQLPQNLHAIYDEIIGSFLSRQRLLCATGIRMFLEVMCDNLSIRAFEERGSGPPVERIGLAPRVELLVSRLHPSAQREVRKLKILGDRAVHRGSVPEDAELRFAIELLERLVESAYGIDPLKQPL